MSRNKKANRELGWIVAGCLVIIAILVLLASLSALVFMVLWNFIAPTFNLPILDFWQSLAITLLIGFVGSAFRSVTSKE